MNITYNGRTIEERYDSRRGRYVSRVNERSPRFAQILWKNKTESDLYDFIDKELEKEGYRPFFLGGDGWDDTSWAWFEVEDKDEYNDFKECYLKIKRSYKKGL